MKPEDKVPSLDLCQELWKLRITKNSESYFVWIKFKLEGWVVATRLPLHKHLDSMYGKEIFPAPDLSELGELLPHGYRSGSEGYHNNIKFWGWCHQCEKMIAPTEPDARAEMLIAVKRGLLKAESI